MHGADPSVMVVTRMDNGDEFTHNDDVLWYVSKSDYPRTLKVLVDSPLVKPIDLNITRSFPSSDLHSVLSAMVSFKRGNNRPPFSAENIKVVAAMLNKSANVRDWAHRVIVGALTTIACDFQRAIHPNRINDVVGVDAIHPNKIIVFKQLLLAAGITFTDDEIDRIGLIRNVMADRVIDINEEGQRQLLALVRTWRDEVEQLKWSYLVNLVDFQRLADPSNGSHHNLFEVDDLTKIILSYSDFFYGVEENFRVVRIQRSKFKLF